MLALIIGLAAAAPNTLVQSGRLLDDTGTPLNGSESVVFTMYGSEGPLWSETHQVPFDDGYYAVTLGTSLDLPSEAFLEPVELGIVMGEVDLGRTPLHATPSAMAVDGAVRLSASPASCGSQTIGTLRMDGTDLEFCDGSNWRKIAAEPASGITQTQVDQWDESHNWGDHAAAGYLTPSTWADAAQGANRVSWDHPAWEDSPELVDRIGPGGVVEPMHRSTSNGSVAACYEWARTVPIPVDPTKAYEFGAWMDTEDPEMATYLGFYAFDGNGDRIGGAVDNPYFKTQRGDPSGWVHRTGYLLPAGTAGSGLATVQLPASSERDWVMPANTRSVNIRFGGCYSSSPAGQHAYFARPSVREVDLSTAQASNLRIYRASGMATLNGGEALRDVPGLNIPFYAEAGTEITVAMQVHQRCNDSYLYSEVDLDGATVANAGHKGHSTWRVNNNILWNGVVTTTGNHTLIGRWQGGTNCSPNTGEHGAGGANVSLTAWVGG